MPSPQRLVIAVSGASGSRYARLLLEHAIPLVPEIGLVVSRVAPQVIAEELDLPGGDLLAGLTIPDGHRVERYAIDNYRAPFASGSNVFDAMVVVPCSQGLIGRMAHGISDCLISRAADVFIKERRKLILVPREMPMSTLHLRNQLTLAEAGALILPACPNFYHRPETVEQVMLTVVDRILSHLDLRRPGSRRWSEEAE